MTEPGLHDQAAREAVRTRLEVNLVVLAGAGAGKTRELVERMANHVRRVSPEVQRLAAITFTRKAAGEMRGRFLLRLRELLAEASGEERQRLEQALGRIDQCFVGTIHSFCAQLLRERPLEAGLDPEFVELDERQEVVLRRQLWDRFVQDCFAAGDPALTRLDELGLRSEDLLSFFVRRCQFSDLPLKPTRTEPPDLTATLAAAEALADQIRAHLPDPLPERRDTFMQGFEQAELFRQHAHLPEYRRHLGWLQRLHQLKEVTLKCWGEHRDFAKQLRDELHPGFRLQVTGPVLRQWRQHVYGHGIEFVDRATAEYEVRRLALGQLTFQDLLLRATVLLRDHPEVRRYFQDRYRTLFVDEFQDTDPVQAEMLFYLTGGSLEERDWRALAPRPGSLFLVGDEKQSIY
ncbi:MAG: UvrD-helicase domain-containing protein, partial [Candidatus Latescibacterota bacterium]